ncbi:MAG: Gfo/Idh/MocA family oxidoreductase [Terriglobia bacterium]|jgi:predicted dehydrogenase
MFSVTRREFMLQSTAGAASLGLFLNGKRVHLEAAPLPRPASPNDRVNVGFIGYGIRGCFLMECVKQTEQANLIAVADCYRGHLDRAKERTEGKIETYFAQYKKLLERKDLDAVLVATPDHWHTPMVVDSLSAGKDVYIEKPMTYRIAEGPKVIEAARGNNRIVQAGSQWVSSPLHKKAKEIVQSGRIGKVTKIIASYNRNSSTGAWNYPIPPDLKDGENFSWEEWLGSAPKRPFDAERVFRYRKYWDYSGGISTDLFVHLINTIHFVMDAKMPDTVAALGCILVRHDGREVPDTLDALFDYPSFHVNMSSTMNNSSATQQGIQYLGTEGTLMVTLGADMTLTNETPRESYQSQIEPWPKKLQEQFWSEGKHREESNPYVRTEGSMDFKASGPEATVFHLAEFFDSVRSRREPVEDAEMGHRSAAAGHMVNLSVRSGKKMVWEAASGTAKEA